MWMTCARRPLRVAELQEAVAFESSDKTWSMDRIPDGNKIIRSCHGLVVRDFDEGQVRLAHHTVKQYLLSPQESVKGMGSTPSLHTWPELQNLRCDPGSAEKMAGMLCIIYLSFSDFETSVGFKKRIDLTAAFKDRGPLSIPTALGLGKYLHRIPFKFFGSEKHFKLPDIDYSKYLVIDSRGQRLSTEIKSKYALLEYIIEYWGWHTRFVSESEGSAQLMNLIQHKVLPFEFRPWGPNQHFGPMGCKGCPVPRFDDFDPIDLPSIGFLHWAAENGHLSVVDMIEPSLQEYLKHERHHDETLLIACRHGQTAFVKTLLRQRKFDLLDGRAIQMAFGSGNSSTLDLLLKVDRLQDALMLEPNLASRLIEVCAQELHQAAYNGRADIVKIIIANHAYIATDATIALCLAAMNGHLEVVRAYAGNGGWECFGRPEERTGSTALHYAAENGHQEIVVFLIQHGSGCDVPNSVGETALIKAAQNGHSNVTEVLLEMGADSLIRGGDAISLTFREHDSQIKDPHEEQCQPAAIHHAARFGHDKVVSILYLLGDLTCGTLRMNALHIGAAYGHYNVVQALPLMGAETDSRTASGMTALHYASRHGHYLVMQLLLDKGCDVNLKDHEGYTALHFAAIGGEIETIKLLVARGAEVAAKLSGLTSEKDSCGDTPLHLAAVRGHVDTVRALVECGVSLKESNEAGLTALDNAIWGGSLETTLILIELGAQWTHYAVHRATRENHCNILEMLLSRVLTLTLEEQEKAAKCIRDVVTYSHRWADTPESVQTLRAWLAKRQSEPLLIEISNRD